jgi:hypothetical protein
MKRSLVLPVVVFILWASPVFTFDDLPEPALLFPLATLAAAGTPDSAPVVSTNIRNNEFFRESLRLANMARLSYDSGDYDNSANYAEESVRYARLSDEYVALQLKIKETNDAITAAKTRLDWALSVAAHTRYPKEYGEARNYYDASLAYRSAEDWDEAIASANRVINALAFVREADSTPALPSQYTVRSWASSRDCLWNIAGRSWAYGDPNQWRLIYNANRSKLPEPNNPDLIHPGMVLDIPSLKGEVRQGLWDAKKTYSPLR